MLPAKYSHLKMELLEDDYKYVLLADAASFAEAIESLAGKSASFCSFSLKGEYSLICPSQEVLSNIEKTQDGWAAMKIVGEMPFGSVQGLIATISSALYKEELGVCIISTFQTDLFFIKKDNISKAKSALAASGWEFVE